MLKVGLIGKGNISGVHLNAYKKIAEEDKSAELIAVCDIQKEVLKDLDGIRTYTDIDEFIAKEKGKLDFVDICLPTYLHAEVSIKAMEAGFNVICEKPMAMNLEECEKMCEVSKRTGKTLMIAQCNRFYGAAKIMKEYIDNGKMGKAYSAEFYREGGSLAPMGYKNWFRDEKLSGGAIHDLHVHDVDLINFFFGTPKAVSVVGLNRIPGSGTDALSANYVYDDLFVNAKCDWSIENDKFNSRVIRVNFEKGYIFVDRTPGRNVFVRVGSDGTEEDLMDRLDPDMYYNEIVYFVDCIVNNKPCSVNPPEASMESIRIMLTEKESVKNGGELIKL